VLSKTAEELDIGIIINNAGSVAGGPYIEINPHHIVDDCNVDLVALYAVNKILIPKMRLR
jgi:short-subunit dehydrogenase